MSQSGPSFTTTDRVFDVVDTHQHLWDPSRHAYSWTAGIPSLNRGFGYDDYCAAARELPTTKLRLTKTVHVEADPDEADVDRETAWLSELAAQPNSLIHGIVAGCRPERPDFAKRIDALVHDHPKVKGLRRVLHTQPDDFARNETFERNVGSIGKWGLTFDLCVLARQLPFGIDLVRACPETSFILDHCGVPDVKGHALDPWRGHIEQLARLPNVVACKVSGLVAYADPADCGADALRPFVTHVVDTFGPDRVMFGSDWPVCTLSCSYATWAETALELSASWKASDREKFFSKNAERVYRL